VFAQRFTGEFVLYKLCPLAGHVWEPAFRTVTVTVAFAPGASVLGTSLREGSN
jgi:hypothetical protein